MLGYLLLQCGLIDQHNHPIRKLDAVAESAVAHNHAQLHNKSETAQGQAPQTHTYN